MKIFAMFTNSVAFSFVKYYAPEETGAVGSMLALLVLVCGLLRSGATGISTDANYVTKQNASCISTGVFFQREMGPNSLGQGDCYLCFCQNNHTAACWRRENRACDLHHYRDFGKRNSRTRRSPLSLGEIFVRDAARDFFNKQSPEQCKPFESSFSDGCPPADWCIGCTVCDCDAHGRWDCHILSFCPDKNGKKQMKKRKGHGRNRYAKKQSKKSTPIVTRSTKITTKPPKKSTRKRSVDPNTSKNHMKQTLATTNHMFKQVRATKVNKSAIIKKSLPKLQAKHAVPSRNKVTGRPLYIKKNISTNKPINSKYVKDKSTKNSTVEVAQQVVKHFMSTMQKMFKSIDLTTNKTSKQVNKVLKKRSMIKQDNKKRTKKVEQELKFVANPTTKVNKKVSSKRNKNTPKLDTPSPSKYGRIKREVIVIKNASQSSDLKYTYKWNTTTDNDNNVKIKTAQNLLINNSTRLFNISHNVNNFTKLDENTNRNIANSYIYEDNPHVILKNETLFNSLNNINSTGFRTVGNNSLLRNTSNNNFIDITLRTTNHSYLSVNYTNFKENITTDLKQNPPNNDTDYKNVTQSKDHIGPFQTILKKLVGTENDQFNTKYNTIRNLEAEKKPRRSTLLTKIKRLFKKIFNTKNRYKLHRKGDLYYRDYDIKQYDYKNYENCESGWKENKKLRQKINELKYESDRILKTIGIIKGLLHILEVNTNGAYFKTSGDLYRLNENMRKKLNIIIRNTNYTGENGTKLTSDQQTQINYIKENVQVFIKSIGTFAEILDYVIQIAMCHNKKEQKIKDTRTENMNNIVQDYSNTTYNKLEKLKKLILNYNILQTRFIQQVYIILNKVEANISDQSKANPIVHNENFNYVKINKTNAIETNSANIIRNIRKLKLLAEKMNTQIRRKRETLDDSDTLEYLLILMEYLIKRHRPTYPSFNDGFDLLIDAIKSAPDIKVIRKKVLDNITEKSFVTRTTTPVNILRTFVNDSSMNTIRQQQIIYSSGTEKNKSKGADQSEDNDEDDDEKIEEIYRSFKSNKQLSSEQKEDEVFVGFRNISYTTNSYTQEEGTRMNLDIDNQAFTYKTPHDYFKEEISTTLNTMVVDSDITSVRPNIDNRNVINEKNKNQLKTNSNIDSFPVDSQANMDWIEENFKEVKQSREVEIKSSTSSSAAATRTHKHTENVSEVSNENEIYNEKKVDNTSAEEIMSKKQLDLLNSLDYVEDEDSKDDKFASDTYV